MNARVSGWLHVLRGLVAASAAVLLTILSSAALAPAASGEPDSAREDMDAGEEVVVTGSRLRRRDFSAPSPIATIDREQIDFSGQRTLEEILNQMPQIIPDFGRTSNNPGDGTARINLRGLGSERTLVMLDGRRVAPSSIGTSVDLNNLPQVLIDRVELITGGATTVYGSDAVAGFVNFIRRKDFDGISLEAGAYVTERGDSNINDINLAWGRNFANGRGNVTLFGGFYDREELFAAARRFTATPWIDTWQGTLEQGGSYRVPEGALYFPEVDLGNGPVPVIFQTDGNPREFLDPEDRYNYAPVTYLQVPLTRHTAGLLLNHDLGRAAEVYVEASHVRNEGRQNLAPVPVFGFFTFNSENPTLTPLTQQVLADNLIPVDVPIPNAVTGIFARRFSEVGPRIADTTTDYSRFLAGITGDIWTDWEFDVWVGFTKAEGTENFINAISAGRLQQGLLVNPATGQCYDPADGCVPVSVFGLDSLADEAVEFIRVPHIENTTTREQKLISGFVRGELFRTWAGSVETVFGMEWRQDDGHYRADDVLFAGDALGFPGSSAVSGKEDVLEAYGEMLLPLANGAAFADYLGLEIGARYSNYGHAGNVDTWKAGLEWRPIPDLRLRSMFQRAVRAPDLAEAFQEQLIVQRTFAFMPEDDPCSASLDPVATGNAEKCILTGLPADQMGIFEAFPQPADFVSGGNPDLAPETAETITAGIVLSPGVLPDLEFAIDYFDMEIEGAIGSFEAVLACFDAKNTASVFCERITRDPLTFNVNRVVETNINRGVISAEGVDIQVRYQTDLPPALSVGTSPADLTVGIVWTHMLSNTFQDTPFTSVFDCAGYYGKPCNFEKDGTTFAEDRVTTNLSYVSGDFTGYLAWRWIGGSENAAKWAAPILGFPDPDLAIARIGSKSFVDVGIGYQLTDSISARLTVANIADEKPPNMADQAYNNNTDTGTYDIFGRSYTFSFRLVY